LLALNLQRSRPTAGSDNDRYQGNENQGSATEQHDLAEQIRVHQIVAVHFSPLAAEHERTP